MKRTLSILFTLLMFLPFVAAAQERTPLKLVATISLPGLKDGDFDHFAADVDGHRLFRPRKKMTSLRFWTQKQTSASTPCRM
jgi:hypothetical protein